jgi:secreted trypsin-like serine protease
MLRLRYSLLAFVAGLLALTASTPAIVIRHDRPDARYLELAKGFKAYGDVVEAGSTLIDPHWLLTAAHVAVEISPYTSFAMINGRRHTIDRIVIHPDYFKPRGQGRRDIALLRLATPVQGVEPVQLFRSQDEIGHIVTFFGRGQTGNGQTGPTGEDGKMRGATNRLEQADDTSVSFVFDRPENATDLEGISGPGDSGGPALVKVNGKWAILGISSGNRGAGKGPCRYDTTEIYARVSTAADWIEKTMKAPPASTVAWKITTPFVSWPKTKTGEIGAALIDAFNSGDPATMELFNRKFRDPQAIGRATPEARADAFRKSFERIGKLTVVEYAEDPDGKLLVLLRNAKGRHYQLSLYFFDAEKTRFDGYWLGEAGPRGN